jgi:hypothetical protein
MFINHLRTRLKEEFPSDLNQTLVHYEKNYPNVLVKIKSNYFFYLFS